MNFDNGIDYVGMFLFKAVPTDPTDLIPAEDPYAGYAEAPPAISGYRDANVAGMACWNCAHFTAIDDADNDGIIDGICDLFEAKADGNCTCDRFTAHADLLRQAPHTSFPEDMRNQKLDQQEMAAYGPSMTMMSYSDKSSLGALNFAGGDAEEEDGLIWKDILRTGKWTHTPTSKGVVKKQLQIIRDGDSDPTAGVISLSELYKNFDEGAVPYVTVPLSDDQEDHKNIARLNTGFVRKLQLIDRDGESVLRAGIDFTEPDVKGKVLRGTIPDVSAGIPFNVIRRSDNRVFNTVLDHVCLTRKPFVEKLVPFGIAAADGDELPVESFEPETEAESNPPEPPTPSEPEPARPAASPPSSLSFRQQIEEIRNALTTQLRLGPDYEVEDITGTVATIVHKISGAKWKVGFRLTEQEDIPIRVAEVESWEMIEPQPAAGEAEEVVAASNSPKIDELQRARELRELRLSQPTRRTGGIQMSTLSLDGVELSALPDDARARIQSIVDENANLRREGRETKADDRIEELKTIPGLNLSDRPGALKLYRQVMLSDDGGPAVILFSEGDEDKKEPITALAILDRFIDGLKGAGDVQLSDQHFASGNDTKPPTNAEGEKKPLEERVEESKQALYGKRTHRK
jgi:hypothetical protein